MQTVVGLWETGTETDLERRCGDVFEFTVVFKNRNNHITRV